MDYAWLFIILGLVLALLANYTLGILLIVIGVILLLVPLPRR